MCRKIKLACKQIRKLSVFCIQETHGDSALLQKHFKKILLDYWAFSSFGDNKNAGGVITFVSKRVCPNVSHADSEAVVIGRALRVTLLNPKGVSEGKQIIYNVHNFGLNSVSTNKLCNNIHKDIDEMLPYLLTNTLFLTGDFNLSLIHI